VTGEPPRPARAPARPDRHDPCEVSGYPAEGRTISPRPCPIRSEDLLLLAANSSSVRALVQLRELLIWAAMSSVLPPPAACPARFGRAACCSTYAAS
jgi:hypothetical protein